MGHNEIFIPPDNRMAGTYTLYAVDNSTVDTEIEIMLPRDSSKDTEITIKVQRSHIKDTVLDVKYRGNSDVLVEIQPIGHNNIYTEIDVRPHNRMWALYEVQEPPKITDVFNPIQDAFTREKPEYQTINYGSNSSLVIGRQDNEIFRSFVQFDFSNWNAAFVIIESKLRLHYSGEFPEGSKIELLTVGQRWHEYGITHRNRPSPVALIADDYILNKEERYVEFEFTNTVVNWIQENIDNYGFVIRLGNETASSLINFKARESNRPPELLITYYDARIYSTGRSQVPTEIFVWQVGESYIDAEITVSSVIGNSGIFTELYVHRYEVPVERTIDIEITVTKPQIDTVIEVAQNDESSIDTEISIRSDININETDIEITVSKDFADSELYVKHINDIGTEITAQRNEDSVLDVVISVTRDNIDTEIYVKHSNNIDTEITVERDEESSVLTEISVTRDFIETEIYVKYRSDIDTEITVELDDSSVVDTEITVTRNSIDTEIIARATDIHEIVTELHVRAIDGSGIESCIVVTRDTTPMEINVRAITSDSTDTDIYVRAIDNSEIYTEVSITRDSILTEITVTDYVTVETEIFVKYRDDILTEITATHFDYIDTEIDVIINSIIPTEITITRRKIDTVITVPYWDDSSTLIEIRPRILQVSDVTTEITVATKRGAYVFII